MQLASHSSYGISAANERLPSTTHLWRLFGTYTHCNMCGLAAVQLRY